jgi:hypothetical protein
VVAVTEFHAAAVAAEFSAMVEDHGVTIVAFGDDEREPEMYLVLQRAIKDEEDAHLHGMDTYYMEFCGQGRSGYGGIRCFELHRDHADVSFDAAVAKDLELDSVLRITFSLTDALFGNLREKLQAVFVHDPCLVIST